MAKNYTTQFWKFAKWFAGLFVLLFIFRLAYGYTITNTAANNDYSSDFFNSIDNIRKNYASEKMEMKNDIEAQASIAGNQKFEKTASIKMKTAEFQKDESNVKAKVKAYNAVIQYEQNLGQKGNRQIHLLIGVNPEKFDAFYADIQQIGTIKATEITKVDKTNEYRQLNAKRISIEKALESLKELKQKGGEISDFISLNEKILEVEEKLQELGVELGNFDSVNEFCTVKLSIYEGEAAKKISLIHRVKVALEWSIKYFSIIIFTVLGLSLLIFLLLVIIDKLKIINSVSNKLNE